MDGSENTVSREIYSVAQSRALDGGQSGQNGREGGSRESECHQSMRDLPVLPRYPGAHPREPSACWWVHGWGLQRERKVNMPERPRDQLDSVLGPQSQWVCWAPLPRAPVTLRMQLDRSELGGGGQHGPGVASVQPS